MSMPSKILFRSFSIFLAAIPLIATALPHGVGVGDAGVLDLGGLRAAVQVYDKDWKVTIQRADAVEAEPGYPVPSEKVYELKGRMSIPDSEGFQIHQWVREIDSNAASYSMTLRNPDGIRCQTVALAITLPIYEFDGREMLVNGLPRTIENIAKPIGQVRELTLINRDRRITITGDFSMMIQDHRRFSVPNFSLRLLFKPYHGLVKEARLDFKIKVEPLSATAADLSQASYGTVSGDAMAELLRAHGTHGGELTFGSVKFALPDAKTKQGALLRLRPGDAATLRFEPTGGQELYLLHNCEAPDAQPEITVHYAGGDTERIQLQSGVDFLPRKPLQRLTNGAVATSENNRFNGLYYSRFPLRQAGVDRLEFGLKESGEWLIAAVTLGEGGSSPEQIESIYYVEEGDEWALMEAVKQVVPGSVLDFSGMLDVPAGKHGHIIVNADGHFEAAGQPGRRLRFFGPNLCFTAQYLDKVHAEKMADELAALGFNSVRFHHFDNLLADPKGSDSTVLLPEQIDRLDYLFHCLKERGIYITIDLYCSRRFRDGELADAPVRQGYAMKQLLPVYPPARENWKKFAHNLLTHRNPYTGLTWGEDPALYAVSLSNENATYYTWNREAEELYLAAYRAWLAERDLDTPENRESRGGLFYRFLTDLNIDMIRDLSGYVRNELGYRGLITEINYKENAAISEIRDVLDFVDNHNYWDHPNSLPGRSWSFPFLHNQMSALKAAGWNPRTIMPSRIFGKPFTVTEINYVFPNRHRAESGPLLGGYAALQDWDGLYRFAWSHDDKGARHEVPINRFDIAEDSLSHIAERVTNLLFVRGDVAPASSGLAWPFGESTFNLMKNLNDTVFPVEFSLLGFHTRIGSLREDRDLPGVTRFTSPSIFKQELTPEQRSMLSNPVITSETGELVYDTSSGTLRIVTPRTESLSLFGGELDGKLLWVNEASPVFQVITASAMDGRQLAASRRIVLFHQTDVTNRHIRFSSESMNAVEHWGKREALIRRASAQVSLTLPAGNYRVQAIGLDGMPKSDIPARYADGRLQFEVDTAAFGGTMVYMVEGGD